MRNPFSLTLMTSLIRSATFQLISGYLAMFGNKKIPSYEQVLELESLKGSLSLAQLLTIFTVCRMAK